MYILFFHHGYTAFENDVHDRLFSIIIIKCHGLYVAETIVVFRWSWKRHDQLITVSVRLPIMPYAFRTSCQDNQSANADLFGAVSNQHEEQ